MSFALVWLALGTFAIGTESFLVAGLLPEIATDVGVSLDSAGHLIGWFAATYAVAAPIMAALTGRFERRGVLLLSLAVFTAANLAAAFAPDFHTLLILRISMAVFACLYTPAAGALAGAMVPPEQRGRALSIVVAGLTVATAVGVPFGTAIGDLFGWRMSFVAVAALGGLAFLGIAVGLPRMMPPMVLSLRQRLAPLGMPAVRYSLLVTVLWVGGAYVLYTFLAAYFMPRGITGLGFAAVLMLFGCCAFAGNLFGGWSTDRIGGRATTRNAVLLLLPIFVVFSLLPAIPGAAVWLAVALVGLWPLAGFSAAPARQALLIDLAPQSAPVVLALNASALYAGCALGAAVGGLVMAGPGPQLLGWAGAGIELLALLALGLEHQVRRRRLAAVPAE
ncbi:MFS transporter [Ferrovibrio xuzhouensis]|uniref:MFS transporter n=1 Tax=Ferrovibrio xuzhouensis TaxID=1576914 RepID=A0ABV7VEQ5_9PROT